MPQRFGLQLLLLEFQCHFIGFWEPFGLGCTQSIGTVEAFAVCVFVTGRIDRLPEPVSSFAGTPSEKECGQHYWEQKQELNTKEGKWIAGFHQSTRRGLFLSVIRARSVFSQMMLFHDVLWDGTHGGIQGGGP